jgi:hypothetical protein
MDSSKLAQDVLAFAGERGLLEGTLESVEQGLVDLLREVGQSSFQLYVDSRQASRGYEGSSRACGCGGDQKFMGYRSRKLATLLGQVSYRRAYYHCSGCGAGKFPFDQKQGLGVNRVSVPLARAAVELTEAMSFRQASEKLQALTGVKLSAHALTALTRHVGNRADELEREKAAQVQSDRAALEALEAGRLYIEADGVMVHEQDGWHEAKGVQCRWEDAEGKSHAQHLFRREEIGEFVPFAWACMHQCGLDNARQSVLLGDGIGWIWNHLGPIADEAVQIVDWHHAKEHLYGYARRVHGEGTPKYQQESRELEALLWQGKVEEVIARVKAEGSRFRSPAKREASRELAGYLSHHRQRMAYQRFRDMGLRIGSGAIEGDCKNLVHARMKRGSPRWSRAGCQSMLSLRCAYANGRRDPLWKTHPLLAAA